ncbi:LemA family protein [Caldicellulosiruptor kronotskyensis 2002]|uniref:LemA family protein n=1 Tax=Caldicellulosiruptor kronotskyensis (strain DSM 18902 / VKM B-2412 / 2002) TaxID=632348 RepID=E4SC26_CALK2|nr:LemA family protein [Caldicellulosiruptor kronotskyensis]ADQ44951.1 LemA family protein [Caldicellulosiruptor kronotskyensis 2002]
MKKGTKILLAILVLVVVAVVYTFSTYNSLVRFKENVDSKWSQVENQLQRRADLIPNLVNTVKAYAKHEKEIFETLAQARSKLLSSNTVEDKAKANDELSSAVSRLLMIVENYPNLKADRTFVQLMDELAGTENRIAVARKDYNEAVKQCNMKIKVFPNVLIARMFGFEERQYFQASSQAKSVPSVDFSK